MKKSLPLIGFMAVVLTMIYLDSPYSLINKEHVEVTSIPNEVILAELDALEEQTETVNFSDSNNQDEENAEVTSSSEAKEAFADYTLEMILEERMIDGEYVIEEYREYEVYRDEDGDIIKSVPTSNFDYLRYYQEE
ncbi:hypothetical protein [Niallia sp. Krafla_26]|uniref:hypothetical protein n=1 Tax=Niallia sp. Krafla_26 TaxID=3064703 RepID=UPI003D175C31